MTDIWYTFHAWRHRHDSADAAMATSVMTAAVILGAIGIGTAAEWWHNDVQCEPGPQLRAIYSSQLERYHDRYPDLVIVDTVGSLSAKIVISYTAVCP